MSDHLFGGSLPNTAGDSDDGKVEPAAIPPRQIAQCNQRTGDNNLRKSRIFDKPLNHRRRGASLKSLPDKSMPIGILPFEREEEGPRDLRTRVGAYTGGFTIELADRARAHRLGGID